MSFVKSVFYLVLPVLLCSCNSVEPSSGNTALSGPIAKAFQMYSLETKEVPGQKGREIIYSISIRINDEDTIASISASTYLPISAIPNHGIVGLGRFKNDLIAVFDYQERPCSKWYNTQLLSDTGLEKYESTHEQMDNHLPPYWNFKVRGNNVKVIFKSDSLHMM